MADIKTKSITIQVNESLLKAFDEFTKAIGSNRSVLINMLMQQVVNEQELPKISAKKSEHTITK